MMTNSETLRALANRVMRLEDVGWTEALQIEEEIAKTHFGSDIPRPSRTPAYLRSLDAARSLMPEEHAFIVWTDDERGRANVWPKAALAGLLAHAATPENALTAAALLARAATMEAEE